MSDSLPVFAMTAAVLYPVFAKAREKARTSAFVINLRQLAVWLVMAGLDNDDRFPVLETAADIQQQFDLPEKILISPRTGEPYEPNPAIAGKSIRELDSPWIIVFYEKTPGADGSRCAVFLDGHVELIPADAWEEVKQRGLLP